MNQRNVLSALLRRARRLTAGRATGDAGPAAPERAPDWAALLGGGPRADAEWDRLLAARRAGRAALKARLRQARAMEEFEALHRALGWDRPVCQAIGRECLRLGLPRLTDFDGLAAGDWCEFAVELAGLAALDDAARAEYAGRIRRLSEAGVCPGIGTTFGGQTP